MRIRTSLALTESEVDQEWRAWEKGCVCHTCRVINGAPEPFHDNLQFGWLLSPAE